MLCLLSPIESSKGGWLEKQTFIFMKTEKQKILPQNNQTFHQQKI